MEKDITSSDYNDSFDEVTNTPLSPLMAEKLRQLEAWAEPLDFSQNMRMRGIFDGMLAAAEFEAQLIAHRNGRASKSQPPAPSPRPPEEASKRPFEEGDLVTLRQWRQTLGKSFKSEVVESYFQALTEALEAQIIEPELLGDGVETEPKIEVLVELDHENHSITIDEEEPVVLGSSYSQEVFGVVKYFRDGLGAPISFRDLWPQISYRKFGYSHFTEPLHSHLLKLQSKSMPLFEFTDAGKKDSVISLNPKLRLIKPVIELSPSEVENIRDYLERTDEPSEL